MEIGIFINNLADSVSANTGIATLLDNPLYIALIMTLLVMLIFYFASGSGSRLKPTFYIFCTLLAVMFVYHRRFLKLHEAQSKASAVTVALANQPLMLGTDRVDVIRPRVETQPYPATTQMASPSPPQFVGPATPPAFAFPAVPLS